MVALGVVPLLLAVTACTTGNPQSTLTPKGTHAAYIYNDLFWWVMIAALIVFVAVEALVIAAVVRFRGREGDPLPAQIHGNTTLEITWTIIPAIILIVILAFTFKTQATLANPPELAEAGGNTLALRVIGHQWWWEFQYPDLGVTTANELHLPVGVPVKVDIESADVIHSFWVPAIAGKTDAIPGRINHMVIQADEEGRYSGQCAEFCGVEHALMRFQVVAESQSTFNSWAQGQRGIATGAFATPVPSGGQVSLVQQGAQVFANGACVTCHTIRGTAAQGKVGPDLTHVGSRASIAANSLPNTPEGLRRWLHNPQEVKPGALMPNLNLNDQDIDALVAYLQSLK